MDSRCSQLQRSRRHGIRAGAWVGITFGFLGLPAAAQVLPQVPVPNLPVQLPVDINGTASTVTRQLDPKRLQDARLIRVQELIRRHRDTFEADPKGNAIIRSEVLAYSPSEASLDQARAAGFTVIRETALAGLGARIVTLEPPHGMSTSRALRTLRKLDPTGAYDFNHVYTEVGEIEPAPASTDATDEAHVSAPQLKIGMIDRGVDATHAVFQGSEIRRHGCGGKAVPDPHGTAVASLIAGQAGQFHGAAPGAQIYAADVFCGSLRGGSVDLVADAFAWLVTEDVPVINVSLVGPRNVMVEYVVRAVLAHGQVVVAAVGNDGPSAPPLFPASYDGVIGVTAVDAHRVVLVEAGRGSQVDFAAPGADMAAAIPGQAFGTVRGTSFASPIVAGLIAMQMKASGSPTADAAIGALTAQAIDLGAAGPDRVYGNGLVGDGLREELAAAGHIEEGSK